MIPAKEGFKTVLIDIAEKHDMYVEGNILKLFDPGEDQQFKKYVDTAIDRDKTARSKRLAVTKQVQNQNRELIFAQQQNEKLMSDLQAALQNAEDAKKIVENDLDNLQKRNQFELINIIVKVSLWMIVGVGILSTGMYIAGIVTKSDTTLTGNVWSNIVSILLTNSFSIIGTIMGVKYASEKPKT